MHGAARRRIDEARASSREHAEGSAPRRRDASCEIALERAGELTPVFRFGGYEVLGRIAVGGMAEVFLARERGEGESARHVALKVIRAHVASQPELAALFLQEGKVALGLGHPNICHTHRFGTQNGRPFLAMELVHGVTLRELFARGRRTGVGMPGVIVAKIGSSVAEALHSAHVARDERGRALGIVHQDVSPQNIMVGYDGTVKLLDFGVASTSIERASVGDVEASHVTVRGKTAYLSPEQCGGEPVDARSDVFSLGVVLFEMLTGSRLFARSSSVDAMRAIACEPLPALPPSVPPPLRSVLERALEKDPRDRYPNAAMMQEDLERYLVENGSVVTSRTIAGELEGLLGRDYGRGPLLDSSNEGVAWLRSEVETLVEPIPLVARRTRVAPRRRATAILGVVALAVMYAFVLDATRARTDLSIRTETPRAEPTAAAALETAPMETAVVPTPAFTREAPALEPVEVETAHVDRSPGRAERGRHQRRRRRLAVTVAATARTSVETDAAAVEVEAGTVDDPPVAVVEHEPAPTIEEPQTLAVVAPPL